MTMKASWGKIDPRETRENIRVAADQMGSLVRSTLGPMGQDKMIVRRMSDGEIRAMVTGDGIAIIEEFEGETDHPIAKRFIKLAEAQEDDYGDGTTMVVILASELLTAGMDLIDDGVHPNDVVEGFSIGAQRTLERWDELAIPLVDDETGELDRELLRAIAETGMTNGRNGSWPLDEIADEVVEAVLRVSRPEERHVRLSHADTVVASGGDVTDTTVLDGAVIPEDLVRGEHLLPLSGPILIVEGDLKAKTPTPEVNVSVEDAEAAAAFRERASSQAKAIADRIAAVDPVAVVAGGEVDMDVVKEITRNGGVCLRNVKDSRIKYLAKVTGATPLSGISPTSEIDPERLGWATVRYQSVKLDDEWLAFTTEEHDETPAGATILVRGGTEKSAEEAERRIKHGKNALRACIIRPEALPAGGAPDVAAAQSVRELAPTLEGREQLAAEAFADVVESIPRTLATTAGHDPIDTLTTLRARHDAGHERAGLSPTGEVVDDVTVGGGGIDPFLVRTSSLVRAMELVSQLLRIDGTLINHDPTVEEAEYPDEEIPL